MLKFMTVLFVFITLLSISAFAMQLEITIDSKQEGNSIIFFGKTNFPNGTKLGINLRKKGGYSAQDYNLIVKNGYFESSGFNNRGDLLTGNFELSLITYFNNHWQKPNILEKLLLYESEHIKEGKFDIVKEICLNINDKEDRIKELETIVRRIPAYKAQKNLEIYHELLALDPTNSKYQEKVKFYKAKFELQEQHQKWVMENIISGYTWNPMFWRNKFGQWKEVELAHGNPEILKMYYFESIDMTLMVNVLKNEIVIWRIGLAYN